MSFYSNLQATASSLLTDYGQSLTFTRDTLGSYDTATGTVSSTASTTYTGYGIVLDYRESEVDGERILQGDRKITLQNVSTTPEINDTLPIDGKTYTVLSVESLNPAGTNLLYKLQVRL